MFWDEITWFYTAAMFIMTITCLYCAFAVLYFVISLIVYPFSRWKITVKRIILFPREILFKFREDYEGASKKLNRLIVLALSALMILECVRWSGIDTNVGSYTEFPHNVAGYYVMVYGSGAKYYKLPAVIRHGSSEESEHFHYIEKAFWPNGGTITFSADEYSPVILNKPTTVLFLNDREEYSEIEVMLTAEKCPDSRIPQTAPNVNLAVIASALSAFFLLLYFVPIQYPKHKLEEEKEPIYETEKKALPTEANVFINSSVIDDSFPPKCDYGKWFSTIYLSADKCTEEYMIRHTLREEVSLLSSFFNTGLFSVLLLTENHDFEKYCFNRLKSALAEKRMLETRQYFTEHYEYIIEVFQNCLRECPDNKELALKAVIESSVDYFYREGDDLKHSYTVRDALLKNATSIVSEFFTAYKQK